MSTNQAGQDLLIRAKRAAFKGRVEEWGQAAMLSAIKDVDAGGAPLDVQEYTTTSQTSTAAVVTSGPGVLYGIRVESGSVKQTVSTSTLDVIVYITDTANSDAIIAAVKCKSNKDAEAYFFGGDGNVGEVFASGIKVKAVAAADGSSNPAAGDRPDIRIYYGSGTTV